MHASTLRTSIMFVCFCYLSFNAVDSAIYLFFMYKTFRSNVYAAPAFLIRNVFFARTVMQWTHPCRYTRMHQHCILALCLFVFATHGLMQLILLFIYFLCTRHSNLILEMQWTHPCRYTCMHQHCVLALCLFISALDIF